MNYFLIKRALDIIMSLLLIILFMPLMMMIAWIILLKMGKPILYVQNRIGINENKFQLLKFRTMINACDKNGNDLADIQRLTKVGTVLRKTSMDELPELFNVLKGDMSLVGPRPLLIKYLPYYTEEEKNRHTVRPGLTGLAQVSGRNNINWDERLRLDIKYVNNMNIITDLIILIKTIKYIFCATGVSVDTRKVEPALDDIRSPKHNES